MGPEVSRMIDRWELQPHPEGGWFRRQWTSPVDVETARGPRPSASSIVYLLEPGQISQWHRIHGSSEMWLWQAGGELELRTGGDGPVPGDPTAYRLGPLAQDTGPVWVGPGCWQTARPVGGQWVLVVCVVSPGFDFADFELSPDAHAHG